MMRIMAWRPAAQTLAAWMGGGLSQLGGVTLHEGTPNVTPRRFHSGLGSDEVLSILQTGERVLSRDDVAQIEGGVEGPGLGIGLPSLNINVYAIDAQGTYQFLRKNRRAIASMLQGTMADNHPLKKSFV
jgi:hypothetical protein